MRKGAICLGLLLGFALAPAWSRSKLDPPELERYLRWGFLRVRPGITLSRLGYDDNIYNRRTDMVGDYTATISPRLEGLALLSDRAFVTFTEQYDYTLYLENNDQNYGDNRFSGRVTMPFGNFGLFADTVLNNIKRRPIDQEDIRPEQRERTFSLGAIVRPGWRTEIEIERSHSDYSHFDPDFVSAGQSISERLDRREESSTVETSYRLLGRTSLLLTGLTKNIEFDFLYPTADGEINRNSDEWRLLGGFEFGEGGILTGSLQIGHAQIDARDPAVPDLSEAIGEAQLIYRLSSSTKLLLEGERLPGFSVYDISSYYMSSNVEMRMVHYLNRLFGVEAGGRLGRLTFPESSQEVPREDDIRLYDVGVRLRMFENSIGRRVEYSLRIGRYNRTSTIEAYDRSRTTFGFGAVVGF
jgi:hypothetical protein